MIYKDSAFEIVENQIKFKNRIILFFLSIFIGFILNFCLSSIFSPVKVNVLNAVFILLGLVFVFLIFKLLTGIYFKSTIDISKIEYIRIHTKDEINFWGSWCFPAGMNKKEKLQVLLIHIKDRKTAVGFVPENIENVISILQERGIKIITKTHLAEQP